MYVIPSGVQLKYPEKEKGIEGYLGVPLKASGGQVLGRLLKLFVDSLKLRGFVLDAFLKIFFGQCVEHGRHGAGERVFEVVEQGCLREARQSERQYERDGSDLAFYEIGGPDTAPCPRHGRPRRLLDFEEFLGRIKKVYYERNGKDFSFEGEAPPG